MKRIKISLAVLGIIIGSIGSFAFKTSDRLIACVSGPATDSSHCKNTNSTLCCVTAGNTVFRGPII